MNSNPKISVIIVNYNGKKWMEKCIDSLKSQTYKNLEIVIVDNASSDDSVEYIRSTFPAVTLVVSDQNRGFAGGNNLGISASTGEYIMLLNNDAWLENNAIEKLFNEMIEKKLDVIGPFEAKYDKTKTHFYETQLDFFGHTINNKNTNNRFYLTGLCVLFSKQLYLETFGLDENFFMYFEECDWFWRLNLLNKKYAYSHDVFVYHAGAGSTGAGIKYLSFLWRNQNTLQMLIKNYRWYNLLWVIPGYLIINIFEMVFFLIIFKPNISLSYLQGWWFNIINLPRTLQTRKWVQTNRVASDREILAKLYPGSAKFAHLIHFFSKNK